MPKQIKLASSKPGLPAKSLQVLAENPDLQRRFLEFLETQSSEPNLGLSQAAERASAEHGLLARKDAMRQSEQARANEYALEQSKYKSDLVNNQYKYQGDIAAERVGWQAQSDRALAELRSRLRRREQQASRGHQKRSVKMARYQKLTDVVGGGAYTEEQRRNAQAEMIKIWSQMSPKEQSQLPPPGGVSPGQTQRSFRREVASGKTSRYIDAQIANLRKAAAATTKGVMMPPEAARAMGIPDGIGPHGYVNWIQRKIQELEAMKQGQEPAGTREGTIARHPDGRTVMFKGGKWVPAN